MFIFFVQTKKTNQKKTALLVKNNFINFVLKTKIHKLTSFKHMNFYVLFTALITNYFSMQGFYIQKGDIENFSSITPFLFFLFYFISFFKYLKKSSLLSGFIMQALENISIISWLTLPRADFTARD